MMIPFHKPSIDNREIEEVVDTLQSGWLTTGPKTAQFEKEFAEYVGAPFALAVNSCTAGLHLALAALGIGPGDEVITTPMTFCATINTILQVGAKCVLADILPDGNIDPSRIRAAISTRTKAIVPVHIAGAPCDMEAIWDIAERFHLYVIEDAAHAVGTEFSSTPVGGVSARTGRRSDVVAYSFYATKNMTTGEGGMVTTHDQDLADRMKVLCLHGINKDAWNRYSDKGKWFYEVSQVGFKYNMSDIQSAVGIHQLRKQEEFISRRSEIAGLYNAAFSQVPELEIPEPVADGSRHCWHLYVLRLRLETLNVDRDEFLTRLKSRGVSCSVHFIPIPMHSAYQDRSDVDLRDSDQAMRHFTRILSIPLYPGLTRAEVDHVIDAVLAVVQESRVGHVALAAMAVGA